MQTTKKSPEQIVKELREAGLEKIEVFEARSPTRPTTIEFRFSPDTFRTQKEALKELGYGFTASGGTIACPPTQKAPTLKEQYEAMSDEEKAAADKQWVKMGGALNESEAGQ